MKLRTAKYPAITRAGDPFSRFKDMKKHDVRQADAKGQTYTERVERTKEMLREMPVHQLKQVVEFRSSLNLFRALELARQSHLIVSHSLHDKLLMETTYENYADKNYVNNVWTGTLVIYEAPDKPFG